MSALLVDCIVNIQHTIQLCGTLHSYIAAKTAEQGSSGWQFVMSMIVTHPTRWPLLSDNRERFQQQARWKWDLGPAAGYNPPASHTKCCVLLPFAGLGLDGASERQLLGSSTSPGTQRGHGPLLDTCAAMEARECSPQDDRRQQ
jgi:hypothetical protein